MIPGRCHLTSSLFLQFSDRSKQFAVKRIPRQSCLGPDDLRRYCTFHENRFRKRRLGSRPVSRACDVSAESSRFIKSQKCGLSTAGIGILAVRPKTRCQGVEPFYCCTWGFKCKVLIASYSFQSTGRICLFFLLPLIWCRISFRLSVFPKLWRTTGITVCKLMYRSVRNREIHYR